MAQKHVIIVGGGIVGASFAYHLAKAGARVTLLDEGEARGGVATPKSWAWINASWGNAESYFRLRQHAMALWRKLDRDVPGLEVNWCGGLLWDLPEDDLRSFVMQHASWGYGVRLVDQKEAAALEPLLLRPPAVAAHVSEEGTVEPVHAVEQLLSAAENLGADVLTGVRAVRLVENGDAVNGVMTEDGVLDADEVVAAAGVATPRLLHGIGLDLALDQPPGLLVMTEPAPELLRGLVMTPSFHVRQRRDGALVAGSDFEGMMSGDDPGAVAQQLHEAVVGEIRGAGDLKLAGFSVGLRPTPQDGVSIIGRMASRKGLYVCVTHSGITLAPALGMLGTQELLDGIRDNLLLPFGPDRFATT